MQSAIYEGQVEHRRTVPVRHAFRYPLFMLLLDLAELDQVFRGRWFWSARRRALARFRREDHFGDPREPLDASVRRLVEATTGRSPEGPIRLLTHLRYFGYCFNPVSFFYCYDEAGEAVQTVVAEVNNTPWGERHVYVLDAADRNPGPGLLEFAPKKLMHVSPFMPMGIQYRWRFTLTDERLLVHMQTASDVEKVFDATLSLRRREITGRSLASVLLRYPLMTLCVILGIHWQALMLWLKGAPVYRHTPVQATYSASRSCAPSR